MSAVENPPAATLKAEPAWSRYAKVRSVGAGGSGQVFLVRGKAPHLPTEPEPEPALFVAKRVYVDENEEQRLCAAMEVKVLQVVPRHPNIVAFNDHFLDDEGYLNIIMEFCSHGDLEHLISARAAAKNPFSEAEVVWLTFQLLCAVRHLHRNQVVHRDVKPGNIFISPRPPGTAEEDAAFDPVQSPISVAPSQSVLAAVDVSQATLKVADFGISKIMRTGSYAHTVVGTPFYIAPEICESRPYTWTADMWAIGCIVFEMCMLQKLFAGDNMLAVIRAISAANVPPLPEPYQNVEKIVQALVRPVAEERLSADACITEFFSPLLTHTIGGREHEKKHEEPEEEIPQAVAVAVPRTKQTLGEVMHEL